MPGRATRKWRISWTTSLSIRSSVSNARVSMVTLTEPSMEFSIGTIPLVHLAGLDGQKDLGDCRVRH